MFLPKKKITLTESVKQLLDESQIIKNAFTKMRESLVVKNQELFDKNEEVSTLIYELKKAQQLLAEESTKNERVVQNIDKLIG